MQATGSQELEDKCAADHGQHLSSSEAEEGDRKSPEEEMHAIMDSGLFQPIQHDSRKKYDKILFFCCCCIAVTLPQNYHFCAYPFTIILAGFYFELYG
jgi:hypothetical protein